MVRNIELLDGMFNSVKLLKKDIVGMNTNGIILGTDNQLASVSNLIMFKEYLPMPYSYAFKQKDLSAFMKEISVKSQLQDLDVSYEPYGIFVNSKDSSDKFALYNDTAVNMQAVYINFVNAKMKPVIHEIKDFHHELLSMKAADGAKMFNIDGFLMTSFNSIHPVNKSDSVDIVFREYDEISYTAEFIITKKKQQCEIHEMYRFRKL